MNPVEQVTIQLTIARLTEERDEARRLHCHMSAQFLYKSVSLDTAKHVATNKGWDCYNETPLKGKL